MNSLKRYEEDTTQDILSIFDPTQTRQAHVIRSHRRPPTYVIRFTRTKLIVGFLALTIVSSALLTPGSTPPAGAEPFIAATVVDVPLHAPDFDAPSETPVAPMPDILPAPPQGRESAPMPKVKGSAHPASRKAVRKPSARVALAVRYALAQQGDRYVWAASGPNAFDCSGLVLRSFQQIGISLPHYTGSLIHRGKRVRRDELRRGDIVFPAPGHVGIYLGNGMMVHASSGKGRVVVAKVYAVYAARRLT